MSLHAFVDESKQRGLLLVAVVLSSTNVTATRAAVEDLHLKGQRRIHFKKESPGRRSTILSAITAMPVEARLHECPSERHELAAREACLSQIVEDLAVQGGERLVIELDDPTLVHDRRTLYKAVAKAGVDGQLQYHHHLRAKEETLLAVPDAIAWSWAEGGTWRQRVRAYNRREAPLTDRPDGCGAHFLGLLPLALSTVTNA